MGKGFLKKLGLGLKETRNYFSDGVAALFFGRATIDADMLDHLEELLIGADLGVEVTERFLRDLKPCVERKEVSDLVSLKKKLKKFMVSILEKERSEMPFSVSPKVTLFVGVNGVGKTTTIGKRAQKLKEEGGRIVLAAGDTFRAGAGEQLALWGERVGVEVIRHRPGADPAAVAFDAVSAGLARKSDHVLIDTAGRLQTKNNLMAELKKMVRVLEKAMPGAPHEKILVLDATTGQNALSQAKLFNEAIGITGIILTKLDGTGRGGIVIPIVETLSVPVTDIGVGEGADDLIPFHVESFVDALFEDTPQG